MIVRRGAATVFALIFLAGVCVIGNYFIVNSYFEYFDAIKEDQKIALDSVERYFNKNGSMSKEKTLGYVELALERSLDIAYINPWFYFNIFIFNLCLIVAAWGFLGRIARE